MPVYEYECNECGRISEIFCKIKEKPVGILCKECGKYARAIISKPQDVLPAWDEYFDENLGHEPILIKGRRHRKELMKERGLVGKPYDKTKHRIMIEERLERKRLRKEKMKNDRR